MDIRPGRRPRVAYERPIRDRVVKCCKAENRVQTLAEHQEISRESMRLAKAGYYLLSMIDEDTAILGQLLPDDGGEDDDDGGDDYINRPRLFL